MSLAARLLLFFGQTPPADRMPSAALAEFRLLAALAQADGRLTAAELDSLRDAARSLLGGGIDADGLIRDAATVPVDDLAAEVRHTTPATEREALMRTARALAAADGTTSEMESVNLERFARLLGLPPIDDGTL